MLALPEEEHGGQGGYQQRSSMEGWMSKEVVDFDEVRQGWCFDSFGCGGG